MSTATFTEKNNRQLFASASFGLLLIIFIYRYFSNSLLHQLQHPVLIFPGIDNTYWLLHYLDIPHYLTRRNAGAIAFDVILFGLVLACAFRSRQRLFPALLLVFLWTYLIVFNTFSGHHYYQVGFLFIAIPFLSRENKNYAVLYDAVRYLFCFLYFSSGMYKLFRGAIFNPDQMQSILMNDNASSIFHNPTGWHSDLVLYLIEHKHLSQGLFIFATILEISLLIGFFTKKYDGWLLCGLIAFHIGNYMMTGIPFLEQAVIFLVFIPKYYWNRAGEVFRL